MSDETSIQGLINAAHKVSTSSRSGVHKTYAMARKYGPWLAVLVMIFVYIIVHNSGSSGPIVQTELSDSLNWGSGHEVKYDEGGNGVNEARFWIVLTSGYPEIRVTASEANACKTALATLRESGQYNQPLARGVSVTIDGVQFDYPKTNGYVICKNAGANGNDFALGTGDFRAWLSEIKQSPVLAQAKENLFCSRFAWKTVYLSTDGVVVDVAAPDRRVYFRPTFTSILNDPSIHVEYMSPSTRGKFVPYPTDQRPAVQKFRLRGTGSVSYRSVPKGRCAT